MLRAAFLFSVLLAAACGGGDDDAPPAGDPDAGGGDLTPALAIPGARCDLAERVGLVEISAGKVVRADLYDRTDPFIGAPAASDTVCDFHEYVPAEQCPVCSGDQVCGLEGACVAAPRRDTGGRLVVRAGGDEQVFEPEAETGVLGGTITLAGTSFALEVELFGQRVTLEEEASLPDALTGFTASLVGAYDAPEAVEATWDAAPAGTHVFTRIPVNHHAAAPTFSECAIGADAGEIRIEQEMLEPLAVATGLEFQGFDHIRFAAAETARGCVEVRFTQTQTSGLEGI